jgi:hypothetical protein
MLALDAELRKIVDAFDHARVGYAIAGGLAVSIYTMPRATEDLEIFIARPSRDRARAVLGTLGFLPAGSPSAAAGGRLEIDRFIKLDGHDVLPVDLIVPIDPALAELFSGRTRVKWADGELYLAGLAALRALCHLRGNAEDRAELETLIGAAVEPQDAEPALCALSGLRELFGALPHLPTEVETQRLRRFDAVAEVPEHADHHDVEAVVAGWRRWWRNGMHKDLVAMAHRLPPGLVEGDRRLSTYLQAARLTQAGGAR